MKPRTHNLKIDSKYFQRHVEGVKNFELRFNDRDYQVGDIIELNELKEISGSIFLSGNKLTLEITYILHQFDDALKPGWVILGTR